MISLFNKGKKAVECPKCGEEQYHIVHYCSGYPSNRPMCNNRDNHGEHLLVSCDCGYEIVYPCKDSK